VLDEPTDLPEGTEVELAFVDDDLDNEDRARLHVALDAADDELRAGKGVPGESRRAVTRLEIAPRAEAQIRRVAAWWRENRRAAPDLFAGELARALETLLQTPGNGTLYAERRGVVIRRVLLPKTRYHVYFSYDAEAEVVSVRAVWHGRRGRGPDLR
jgi:plasmid stabilization system protein ParE